MDPKDHWHPISPDSTGIRGPCPRCGRSHLFDGFLKLKSRCEVRGLAYSFVDPADGPAFFVICFTCVEAVARRNIYRRPQGGASTITEGDTHVLHRW